MEIRKMYTPQEVADILGIDRRTIYRWLDDGKVRATKVGERFWRITAEDLQELMTRGTNAPRKESEEQEPSPKP